MRKGKYTNDGEPLSQGKTDRVVLWARKNVELGVVVPKIPWKALGLERTIASDGGTKARVEVPEIVYCVAHELVRLGIEDDLAGIEPELRPVFLPHDFPQCHKRRMVGLKVHLLLLLRIVAIGIGRKIHMYDMLRSQFLLPHDEAAESIHVKGKAHQVP